MSHREVKYIKGHACMLRCVAWYVQLCLPGPGLSSMLVTRLTNLSVKQIFVRSRLYRIGACLRFNEIKFLIEFERNNCS